MSGRHHRRGWGDRTGLRRPLGVALPAVLVGLLAVTVSIVAANIAGCSGTLPLRVAATLEIAPVLEELGAEWSATKPEVDGRCVELTVVAEASANVAGSLTVHAGRAIDVGGPPLPTPREDEIPAVWVPDSTAWLTRVQAIDGSAFEPQPRSIVSSPVVVAMPQAAAAALGSSARLDLVRLKQLLAEGDLKLGIAEPRRETSGLVAVILLSSALATSDEDLPILVKTVREVTKASSMAELLEMFKARINAAPASEQAVIAHNATGPDVPLVAVPIEGSTAQLDYPYAIRSNVSRQVARAARMFRSAVLAGQASERFARRGFRTPDGTQGQGFPVSSGGIGASAFVGAPVADREEVAHAINLWTAANAASRSLALFDVTASMATPMQTSRGVATRAQVMVSAATGGLALFTNESSLGLWTFAERHEQVFPIDTLTPARREIFNQRMASVRPVGTNRCELYATLLEAYEEMLRGYDAARPNLIVVFADGADSDSSQLGRQRFRQEIQKLADPTKPIRVIIIGVDVSPTDAAVLQEIAQIVGGGFFELKTPEQIQTIFLKALLRLGPA